MNTHRKKPAPYPIINRSGFDLRFPNELPILKDGCFRVLDAAVAGDAPKDFLRIYRYGDGRRANSRTWPAWIAKVGHKYYPNESVTEHLLTRIGQALELKVADSDLMWFGPQLRFMSRYFLNGEKQSLVHGAEIFAGHLADRDFVEEVERTNQSRNLFTFQFVEEALKSRFPRHWQNLLAEFTRLLAFDAIVGNNDRHFYNWGVVLDVEGRCEPRFSPIYDTARALYWNTTDARLAEIARDPARRDGHQEKYVQKCYPKTGWDGSGMPNHFDLMRAISTSRPELGALLRTIPLGDLSERTTRMFDEEFRSLMNPLRAEFIQRCLDRRATLFHEAVANL
ncbi:HipA domain-containing protein [bacterium]|nr:HipA domain-containing protein [bacterium]